MQRSPHRRDGFALAVAIGAIVVIGALIAGVFFASTQQFRIGRNTLLQSRAQTSAEYGLHALFDPHQTQGGAQWASAWNLSSSPPGLKTTVAFASNGAVDTVRVTKLGGTDFLVTSESRVSMANGAQARRRLGTLVTLLVPDVHVRGAVTVKGSIQYGGSAEVHGEDQALPDRDCPPLGATLPALAIPPDQTIKCSGCSGDATGNPPVFKDTVAAKDSIYSKFGDVDWTMLSSLGKVPTGSFPAPSLNADGSCNTGDPDNWGDPESPSAPCGDYYPIIHVPGDLSLTGGIGQGVLLVDGNMTIAGTFTFYGPVIVHGNISNTGNATIIGGMMAGGTFQNKLLGNAVVQYSSCALSLALHGSANPSVATLRPWVELP